MIKKDKNTLKNLEELFKALEYKIRYEKGQFQAGYCLVKQKQVIVINKFYTTDARVNCLLDILQELELENQDQLEEDQKEFLEKVMEQIAPVSTTVNPKDFQKK